MRILMKGILIMGLATILGACGVSVDDYNDQQPQMDIQEYFTGPIKAWGIVQDRTGKVRRRFDIDLHGSWDGDEGVLKEQFHYYDGEEQKREWRIRKLSNNKFEGFADDVPDKATGESSGNAVRWAYALDVPVGDSVYTLQIDDWMFLMNDGVLINRSYMKKFGIKVGELTIFMKKDVE